MFYAIFLLLITGLALIIVSLSGFSRERVTMGPAMPGSAERKSFKILAPFVKLSKSIVDKLRLTEKIKLRLDAAKIKLTPDEFFAIKIILCLIFSGLSLILFTPSQVILRIFFALFAGYILPDLWVNRKIAKRKHEIARVLPETIDLLGLCIEAGLDFMMAIKWVIEKSKINPFLEELASVSEEIRWGKPRTQALKDMSKRLNIPEVSSFTRILVQADRLGTPVSETFAILSEDTRSQRYRRGERFALKAPIKILLPLIFFIMPVIAIIVGGPIMLQFMQGGLLNLGK